MYFRMKSYLIKGIECLVKLLNDVQYNQVYQKRRRDTELALITLANLLDSKQARYFKIEDCDGFKLLV